MRRFLAPAFGLVGVPLMFWIGYREGVASLGDSDQIHEYLDSLFKKHDNTFRKKTVLPPIRRISYPHMTILYSTALKVPLAVHETIDSSSLHYVPIKALPEGQDIDYGLIREQHRSKVAEESLKKFAPGLSKGYMASPFNYLGSQQHLKAACSFPNSLHHDANIISDVWESFQVYQRGLTSRCKNVQVISGPLFSPTETKIPSEEFDIYRTTFQVMGKQEQAVPQRLYKIIKCNKEEGSYFSAFAIDAQTAKNNDASLSSYEVPIEQLQKKTGLVFGVHGKSLTELEATVLGKPKSQFDREWVEPLIQNSQTFKDLQASYSKLKAHSLTDTKPVIDTITRLSKKRLQELQHDSSLDDCTRIPEYIEVRSLIQKNSGLRDLAKQVKSAEDSALKTCTGKEKLQTLKGRVSLYTNQLSDLVETVRKIDGKLMDLKKKERL